MNDKPHHEHPHHGGSYVRKADGKLDLVERTAPHPELNELGGDPPPPVPMTKPDEAAEQRGAKRKEK
jgi:hypothetical protein